MDYYLGQKNYQITFIKIVLEILYNTISNTILFYLYGTTGLAFTIGIRHEIEHQKTDSIDEYIGAKLQACALNYNREIIKMFGDKHSIKDNLSLAIQFSPISPEQEQLLRKESVNEIPSNVKNFIATFESELDDEELKSLYYSYRIVYIPIQVNRANQADRAIEFISPDSDKAKDVERVLVKAVEKAKFLPSDIVKMMNEEGYSTFSMHYHTQLWKAKDAKNKKYNYGVKVSKQWYWYENWIDVVRDYCQKNNF
ncbi:DUF3644 domain-containing protein [Solobacterium moorei]|uniref:DUF3644 domain-containing protein n=1 Tax=Solobacterium moorei TaxID=102148 RepID=UPI00316AEB70